MTAILILGFLALVELASIAVFAIVALAIRLLFPSTRPEPAIPPMWVEHLAHLNRPAVWRRRPTIDVECREVPRVG